MLVGLMLASLAALMVLGMAQQSQQQATQQLKQVYVVTVAKDVPENSIISPEMLSVKPFPADFAPTGAVATVEETTGRYAATRLFKDQVLLRAQLATSKRARDLASNLPPGKVAFWMPLPEIIGLAGGIKTGDRVDVLLTINIGEGDAKFYSTQTTLQNVEVFSIGSVEEAIESGALPTSATTAAAAGQAAARGMGGDTGKGSQAIVLLVDHQDAVILKFVKDAENGQAGIVDLVLRSADDAQIVRTDGVSPDTLIDRFKFRVPAQIQQAAAKP
jgi:Flp pilus assembly protein CpaB